MSHSLSKEDVVIAKPVWVIGVELTGKPDPDSHFFITFRLADKFHFLRFQTEQGVGDAGETAQSVNYLLSKHEDPNSVPISVLICIPTCTHIRTHPYTLKQTKNRDIQEN